MLRAIEHVGVKVADLERSIDFYTRVVGFRLVERGERADVGLQLAFFDAPGGGAKIELIHPVGYLGGLAEGVVNHLSFSVDDIEAAMANLASKGGRVAAGPLSVLGGRRIAFFYGPDGEKLELFQDKGR